MTTTTTALQPLPPQPVQLRRTERVLKVKSFEITLALADAILELLHGVAEEHAYRETEQRLRWVFNTNPQAAAQIDPAAHTADDFVERNATNPAIRTAAQIPSYERYTFLSPASNVQFECVAFDATDLPKDVNLINARADGINGRFIDVQIRSSFKDFSEARNWQLNQIVIHGEDHDWVNATYERLRSLIAPQTFKTRSFVYSNVLTLFWLSIVLLLFAEYHVAKLVNPAFSLTTPLSGLGILVIFGVLWGSLLICGNLALSAYSYCFPYFEIEGNLARTRVAARKAVAGLIATLYSAAFLNVVVLLLAPLRRLIP